MHGISTAGDIVAPEHAVPDGPGDLAGGPGAYGLSALENPIGAGAALISPATIDGCALKDECIDAYLWSLYERTQKVDAVKQTERRTVTIKRKGKTLKRVITVTRRVDEDFTWKDIVAAERSGLSLKDYAIGGMDPEFKRTLYRALRAMDRAGLEPGITSAFRCDYRQGIATGTKAQTDRSFHGGSMRGGYGRGRAVDLVSVKGATRGARWVSSATLWAWIDTNGRSVGIGRPYLGKDPPHVAAIDGEEYAKHRGADPRRATAAAAVRVPAARTATATAGVRLPAADPRKDVNAAAAPAKPRAKAPARQVFEPKGTIEGTAADSPS